MLLGRQEEQARIERLLDGARNGRAGVLVVRGEPGIGKTTLLRHAQRLAESMTVLWATGLPAEAELEYSGLVELLRPLVPFLERLPEHQATVLREAVGLAPPADRRDRFAVGAALLGLFAAAADARPVLVVVDDAQWLDHASADALRFAARRVLMDRVAVLVAVRDGEGREFDTTGFEELVVGGLGREDVGALLGRSGHTAGTVFPRAVLQRVHDVTGGNPLAVIELGEVVPAGVLQHPDEPTPLPVGPAIQRAFARRAGELPEPARRALLVVAVAMVADVETIDRALAGLGLTLEALEQAEDAGLVSIDRGVVEFEHPLVRSAVHSAATASERRVAHRALADALAAGGNQDRRAWHLAGAALGPDEEAAAALEGLAWRSHERGGHAAASSALEHAARLTPDGLVRLDRLAGAAEAAWGGGAPATAITLLDEALTGCRDPARRARLLSLRGRIEHEIGHQVKSRELLLEAADLMEQVDAPRAASILLYSLAPIHYGGDVDAGLRVAERARELVPRDGSDLDSRADSFLGWALFQAGRGAEGVPILEQAIRALPVTGATRPQLRRAAISLSLLERSAESERLVQQVVDVARREGPTAISYALDQAARYAVRSGAWSRAVAIGEEGLALTKEIGTAADVANILVTLARVDAACGHEDRCRERITAATETAAAHGLDTVLHQGQAVVGLLDLGLGRLESAAEELERVARSVEQLGAFTRDLTAEPDLVEALLRLGRVGEAHEWLEAYAARGARASPRWAAALVARCRGLLARRDDESARHLQEALDLHRAVPDRFQEARTLLCFGERLRGAGRKVDAREPLRQALAGFEALGALPWAERTRAELRATGETIRRAGHQFGDDLTPRELQVALQVADGKTNKEAAAALFLSPKTIEFHLAGVYPKLGVRTRAELIKRVTTEGAGALPST